MADPKHLSPEEIIEAVKEWFEDKGIPTMVTALKDRLSQRIVPVCSAVITVFDDGSVAIGHNSDASREIVSIVHALREQFAILRQQELEREAANEPEETPKGPEEPPRILH